MGITIRKLLPEDANDYTLCIISCWQSAYKGIVPDDYLSNMLSEKEQRVERSIKVLTNPGECEYYGVMYEGEMIGFLIIHKNDGEIWAIYLIEEFRGKGYGKEMLDFAITELKGIGHKRVSLWVFEENIMARRFYEKCNLVFDGTKREMKYGKSLVQLKYVCNFR